MSTSKVVKIGVFVPNEVQLLDLACIDVFSMMSKEYLSLLDLIPSHVAALAPSVAIYYITVPGKAVVPLTAGVKIVPTHDITHADVQPGMLDIILVPGPDPRASRDREVTDFLRRHAETPTTDVLSVCTGIYVCAEAGILAGKTACGPRGLQDDIKKRYPGVKSLVGDKYRWIQDGNLWSSGELFTPILLSWI
jgi:transcriptional regulator GlxA family with amidase domain